MVLPSLKKDIHIINFMLDIVVVVVVVDDDVDTVVGFINEAQAILIIICISEM